MLCTKIECNGASCKLVGVNPVAGMYAIMKLISKTISVMLQHEKFPHRFNTFFLTFLSVTSGRTSKSMSSSCPTESISFFLESALSGHRARINRWPRKPKTTVL